MKFKKETLVLILIIILGLFLRVYKISDNPPALNWDEVSHGFNAYSILKTGRDEWGARFPLIFRCFGDYKLPLYIYLTVIPAKLLGLTPLAVRLVSILSGVGLVIIAYFLAKEISKNKGVGLLAAFLAAVSPWSLFLSRIAVEANLAAFLFALGALLFCRKKFLLASLFWGLSLQTYNSARILAPLMFLFLVCHLIKLKKIKKLLFSVIIFSLFLAPIAVQLLNKSAGARLFWVSLIDQGTINRIIEKRERSSLPLKLKRLIYNRPTYFLAYSTKNYLKHFSPNFLFFRGGDHYQFSLPDHCLLYLTTAPFLLLGLIWLVKDRQQFLIFWFFASLIPSAITRDAPHVLRSILILPLPMILGALGVWQVRQWLIKNGSKLGGKLFLATFVAVVLGSFVFWWRDYWRVYRPAYSWAWQYGYQEVVDYVKKHYGEYDRIVFTKKYGEPHEFILFYWPWEPSYYQQDPKKIWDHHAHWYWVDAFDKFEFWNDWEIKSKLKTTTKNEKLLLITSPGNWIEGGKLVKTIGFLDGTRAFEIVAYHLLIL